MHDPRIDRLAEILVDHSTELRSGEKVLIEAFDLPDPQLVRRLVQFAAERGAIPLVSWKNNAVLESIYQHGTKECLALAGQLERARMEQMDAYIGIRGASNGSQFAEVRSSQMDLFQKYWWQVVHSEVRVPRTKWVVLRYPTDSMAQAADMSTAAFEDFYFDVCTADYAKMASDQEPLVARMEAANDVRIVSPHTGIQFSIRGMPVRPCFGQRNIPDGEVFTAPVRDSVQGVIRFNTPSRYQGSVFEGIELEFRDGRITRAECGGGQTARLNEILDSDEGARHVGEWSLGCNNRVCRPMMDTLFDEKIGGSFHLTPGSAYDECDNGNRSRVHWDLVLIQTPAYGGGEIWFDDELVRKDGKFISEDLKSLNDGL